MTEAQKRIARDHLEAFQKLNDYGYLKDAYKKRIDFNHYVFTFKVYNKDIDDTKNMEIDIDDRDLVIEYSNLVKLVQTNKKLGEKIRLKKLGKIIATSIIIAGSLTGVAVYQNNYINNNLEIMDMTNKEIKNLESQYPEIKITSELKESIYNQIRQQKEQQREEERKQKYEEEKKNYEETHPEKILSTGESLDSYMERNFKGNYDHPAYKAYQEYKNANNDQNENAKTR